MLTTEAAAALLRRLMAGQGESGTYTAKYIAELCARGLIPAQRFGKAWQIAPESVEQYAAAPKPKGGRPKKERG